MFLGTNLICVVMWPGPRSRIGQVRHFGELCVFLGGLCVILAALVLLPMLLLAWVFDGLFHALFGTGSHGLFGAL